ncbi:MAG: thioredoxin domain-containing protein, partial [bacterium]
ANIVEITNAEQFDKAIAGGVVLVDFNADWCGPCRALKPIVGSLADKFAGKVAVLSVNVDKQQELARKYGISSIPDVRLFSGGKEVERWIGVRPEETYKAATETMLGGRP